MSFFPQTNIKANGNNYTVANLKCGEFTGVIKDIRQIKSNANPTVFAVVDIEVAGEPGLFQDYLNFNSNKAEQSMGFLVSHTKQAVISAGKTVSLDEEKDMAWVESTLSNLKDTQTPIHFRQSQNGQGRVTINFIPASTKPATDF